MKKTLLCKLLEIEHPVIQAPMNWITGAELASAAKVVRDIVKEAEQIIVGL